MRYLTFAVRLLVLAFALSGPLVAVAQDATPTTPAKPAAQPSQPATGPGGAEFAFDCIRAQHYGLEPNGTAAPTGYWLFEPIAPRSDGTLVAQSPLPLVIFLHGYEGTNPQDLPRLVRSSCAA